MISHGSQRTIQATVNKVSRSSTQKEAKNIGVTGFVLNASDGTVSINRTHNASSIDRFAQVQGEAQGTADQVNEFIQYLNKGPSAASVSGVKHNDISVKSGESSFNVK
jgi:acylphosphatase